MGRYLDLIRTVTVAAPSRGASRDISDKSAKRELRSLQSLMSQPDYRAAEACAPRAEPSPSDAATPPISSRAPSVETAADAPGSWRDLFEERAAIREHDGGYDRAAADRLAWGELQNRWHMLHGERVPPHICAGCREEIGDHAALELIDGSRVHLAEGNGCRYGSHWRGFATRALTAMGLTPPADEGQL